MFGKAIIKSLRNIDRIGNCLKRYISNEFIIEGTIDQNNFKIGDYNEINFVFTQEKTSTFSELCGDTNPIHIDPVYAKDTIFGKPVVHGIFVSSLFSTLFGRSINGSIYISQSLEFKRPVYVNSSVNARIEIKSIENKRRGDLLTCSTVCISNETNEIVIIGEAKVLVPKR